MELYTAFIDTSQHNYFPFDMYKQQVKPKFTLYSVYLAMEKHLQLIYMKHRLLYMNCTMQLEKKPIKLATGEGTV